MHAGELVIGQPDADPAVAQADGGGHRALGTDGGDLRDRLTTLSSEVTLALYRGLAQILLEERSVSSFPEWYQDLGFGTVGDTPLPWTTVLFIVLALGFAVFLHLTRWGRALYAIGNNETAARFSGLAVDRAKLTIYGLSGLMAGLAAWIFVSQIGRAHV